MYRLSILVLLLLLTSSCLTMSDIVYLQKNESVERSDEGHILYSIDPYKIREYDVLKIKITSLYPTLKSSIDITFGASNIGKDVNGVSYDYSSYDVSKDGNIDVPLLGVIYVKGKTIEEVKEAILTRLALYFDKDKMYVKVKKGGTFSVIGEVNGVYPIGDKPLNLLEVVAMVGGIPDVADKKSLEIIRQGPDGAKSYIVNLTDEVVMNSPYFWIQPNDIINVKPLTQKILGAGHNTYSIFVTITSTITTVTSIILTYISLIK